VDAMVIQVVLFATVAGCVLSFAKLLKKVKRQQCSKWKAVGLYLIFSFLPIGGFVLLFLALIGLEEITGQPLIGELMARSLVLVVAIGALIAGLSNLIFAIWVAAARTGPEQESP
jgi:hypothetical protein